MRTFVINLNRNPERMSHMAAVLGTIAIDYERIPAIDGRTLSSDDLAKASPILSPGEVGCLLSHHMAWRLIAEGGAPYAAVLEDDIHVSPVLASFLADTHWIPKDADVVTLEAGRKPVELAISGRTECNGRQVCRLISTHSGAAAYVLSARLARVLITGKAQLDAPADAVLFDPPPGGQRASGAYQVHPALCIQDSFLPDGRNQTLASNLDRERRSARRSSLIYKLRREIVRPLRRLAGRLTVRPHQPAHESEWLTVRYVAADQPTRSTPNSAARQAPR